MNEHIRLPDLSTDKDFQGESFAPHLHHDRDGER